MTAQFFKSARRRSPRQPERSARCSNTSRSPSQTAQSWNVAAHADDITTAAGRTARVSARRHGHRRALGRRACSGGRVERRVVRPWPVHRFGAHDPITTPPWEVRDERRHCRSCTAERPTQSCVSLPSMCAALPTPGRGTREPTTPVRLVRTLMAVRAGRTSSPCERRAVGEYERESLNRPLAGTS
jgi:hypothetical protein